MKRTISNAKVKALVGRGVEIEGLPEKKKPVAKPAPAVEQSPKIAEALADTAAISHSALQNQNTALQSLAATLGDGQMMLAEKLQTVVIDNQNSSKEPVPYRFTVQRDRKGLIEHIDAYPLKEE